MHKSSSYAIQDDTHPVWVHVHIYTHISVGDSIPAHNQSLGEGNVSRDTCNHCFLHKTSITRYKLMWKSRRPLLTGQAWCHRARMSPTLIDKPALPSSSCFHPHWLRDRQQRSIPTCWAVRTESTPGLMHLGERPGMPLACTKCRGYGNCEWKVSEKCLQLFKEMHTQAGLETEHWGQVPQAI